MGKVCLHSPYSNHSALWLRGNLHAHTTISDGDRPPEQVIAAYEQLGYHFLALTDHDALAPIRDYQPRTHLTLIPGVEVSARGPHILQLGLEVVQEPAIDRQRVLDVITAHSGLAIFNHPNWEWHFNHFPQDLMHSLDGATGIEIYNAVVERLEGSALATDRWDRLLSHDKWLWGFANDDSHAAQDDGRAWNMVQWEVGAPLTAGALLEALRAGRFYASTGVTIQTIEVDGLTVRVKTSDAQCIRFVTRWGAVAHCVEAPVAEWTVPDVPDVVESVKYVRVECFGLGTRMAWAQPIQVVYQP
ncbi:MAG: CehA/McbA family metallohydrolase [Anaerolineae bacterium]|nr:CehA/McbA family metallohydrolase [Thermoflexales bacterium]MDW8406858.1 CehA/McbA family metallohydrolase [Anaerolineae bacterium]